MTAPIAGSAGLLVVQRSYSDPMTWGGRASALTRKLGVVGCDVAVMQRAGRDRPSVVDDYFQAAGSRVQWILDPECWTRQGQLGMTVAASRYFPYLQMNMGASASRTEARWLMAVADAQLQHHVSVLLSPGLWVGRSDNPDREIRLRDRMETLTGRDVWLNLPVHRDWIIENSLRVKLINSLQKAATTEGLPAILLKVEMPLPSPAYTEPRRNGYLPGLVDFVKAVRDLPTRLVVANSGMTGWLAMALGASGFGTGTGLSQRVWLTSRGGRQGPPRYYERSLIHSVRVPAHQGLAGLSHYVQCRCQYCSALVARNGMAVAGWDRDDAAWHYITCVADEVAALLRGVVPAKDRVQQALTEAGRPGVRALLAGNQPTHLRIWHPFL